MSVLTVTAKGQVTLRKEVLNHLGIHPGDKLAVELLPNGQALIEPAKRTGSMTSFIGLLKDKTTQVATLEEIDQTIADGWVSRS